MLNTSSRPLVESANRLLVTPPHIRSAQCKLRVGSVGMGTEMLPLRFAQGFGSRAQHDKTGFDC